VVNTSHTQPIFGQYC